MKENDDHNKAQNGDILLRPRNDLLRRKMALIDVVSVLAVFTWKLIVDRTRFTESN